jgi:5-methylcytosine-specific restriction endonuclease McrA
MTDESAEVSLIVGRIKSEVEERSKVIRQDFNRRYNLDELREQLYRRQGGVCAICKKWMQDSSSVICAIDHATSVYIFASWNASIEEACEHANRLKNLVAVHVPCNSIKQAQDPRGVPRESRKCRDCAG